MGTTRPLLFDETDLHNMAASKAEQLVTLLKWRIRAGEFACGHRLPSERRLAETLGVSRVTVRIALAELAKLGYVNIRPGPTGGAFVTDLTQPQERWFRRMREDLDAFDDAVDYRSALETRAAWLAATRRSHSDIARLQRAIAAFDPGLWTESYAQSNWLFHDAVARASGSPRLIRACRIARGELWVPPDRLLYESQSSDIMDQHAVILRAIRLGDSRTAASAMESHLEQARHEIRLTILLAASRMDERAAAQIEPT